MPSSTIYIVIIIFISGVSLAVGILVGFGIIDAHSRTRLSTVMNSIARIISKSIKRTIWSPFDIEKLKLDKYFEILPDEVKKGQADEKALNIVKEFKQLIKLKYSSQLVAIYLYGSRARGDFELNSDIDVAVFFTFNNDNFNNIKRELQRHIYSLLLKYGYYIQLRIYDGQILNNKITSHDYLATAAFTYGILI